MIIIQTIPFEEIVPFWHQLWPERQSPLKTHSSWMYLGGVNMSIYDNVPTFLAAIDINFHNKIIGVNSGFASSKEYYRSRGLWVAPSYRGKGTAQKLLQATENQAIKENCRFLWSIPRQRSLSAYTKFGFIQTSGWFEEGMEFGPNCYVLKTL